MLLRSNPSLRGNDFRVGRQELCADVNRNVQKPSGIVSEVQDHSLHATLLQFIERLSQLFRSRLVELNQADVTDLERTAQLRVEYLGPLDALHFYLRPLEREIFDLLCRGSQNRQGHFLPGGATEEIDRILQLHLFS